MKNNILAFLLGGFVFISFAMSTTNLMTVKPAIPKSTVFINDRTVVKDYIRAGYVVKTVGGGDYHRVYVMEKY